MKAIERDGLTVSEAINSADLNGNTAGPLAHTEYRVATEKNELIIDMLRSEFDGLKSWLTGPDGRGGILDEMRDDLKSLEQGQRQIEERLSTTAVTQMADKAALEAQISSVKNDVDNVGDIARAARDNLVSHCDDIESRGRFKIETLLTVVSVCIAAAAVIVAVL